jgi:tripartite-type tricarboxylate transporter receptor subunit TctC
MQRRLLLSAPALLSLGAAAQDRPTRIITPFPPGGAADFLARVVGERLSRGLQTLVTIENRSGAGGNIGTAAAIAAARGSENDGTTLLLSGVPIAVNRFLYATLPFDAERDLVPLAMIAVVPNIMVVPNGLGVNTVAEFVALARTRPMHYASIGNGTSLHLAGAQFAIATGLDMTHVPYRETSAANNDLIAGRVEVMFQTISAAAELVRGGRMKALAVTSASRAPGFDALPTLREAGVDVVSEGWFGLFAIAGTPTAALARLERETLAAASDPIVAARINATGSIPQPLDGAAFSAFIAEEVRRLGELIRAANIRAD